MFQHLPELRLSLPHGQPNTNYHYSRFSKGSGVAKERAAVIICVRANSIFTA